MSLRDRLIDLIVTHGLERREVARMLAVNIETVDHWLLPHEAADYEEVPEMAIELLGYKLAERDGSK